MPKFHADPQVRDAQQVCEMPVTGIIGVSLCRGFALSNRVEGGGGDELRSCRARDRTLRMSTGLPGARTHALFSRFDVSSPATACLVSSASKSLGLNATPPV